MCLDAACRQACEDVQAVLSDQRLSTAKAHGERPCVEQLVHDLLVLGGEQLPGIRVRPAIAMLAVEVTGIRVVPADVPGSRAQDHGRSLCPHSLRNIRHGGGYSSAAW